MLPQLLAKSKPGADMTIDCLEVYKSYRDHLELNKNYVLKYSSLHFV